MMTFRLISIDKKIPLLGDFFMEKKRVFQVVSDVFKPEFSLSIMKTDYRALR